MIRALIVDDERLARRELVSLLEPHANVTVVAEAATVREAVLVLEREAVDVIFLDIEMGSESGFDLLTSVTKETRIIFVTAHASYAINAFDVAATDYLLKPVAPERLARAVERLASPDATPAHKLQPNDRLLLPDGRGVTLVKLSMISAILSAGDYTEVCLNGGAKLHMLRSLKEWELRLPDSFVRIHRSALVNLDQIVSIEEWFHGSYRITVKGVVEPIVSSRRLSAALRQRLG